MDKNSITKILKNKNNQLFILIIIIGLIFVSVLGSSSEKTPSEHSEEITISEEERLREILSDIDGAGDVSVMITYYGTNEKNIAYEKRKNMSSFGGSNESYDEKAVMADGEPMIINETYPEVKGVVVTAEGAQNPAVREALINAVRAALDVGAHKICIYKKGGN